MRLDLVDGAVERGLLRLFLLRAYFGSGYVGGRMERHGADAGIS